MITIKQVRSMGIPFGPVFSSIFWIKGHVYNTYQIGMALINIPEDWNKIESNLDQLEKWPSSFIETNAYYSLGKRSQAHSLYAWWVCAWKGSWNWGALQAEYESQYHMAAKRISAILGFTNRNIISKC